MFLNSLYDLVSLSSKEKTIDLIFETIDGYLNESDFLAVDSILENVDFQKLDVRATSCLLSSVYRARTLLKNYSSFYERARKRLLEITTEKQTQAILSRFKYE